MGEVINVDFRKPAIVDDFDLNDFISHIANVVIGSGWIDQDTLEGFVEAVESTDRYWELNDDHRMIVDEWLEGFEEAA